MVAHEVESNSAHRIREAIEKPVEVAKEYPVASMLVVFGVGLGVGVLLSQVACASMHHEPTFSERLSHQIYHAVNDVIPEALRGQLARFQS
jgi:Na+-transporting NADH:ubiquinone oxidoreductase subunit NqrE